MAENGFLELSFSKCSNLSSQPKSVSIGLARFNLPLAYFADTLEHLVTCQYSTAVTTPLLQFLISQDSSISPGDIITLNIKTTESMELPAVWLISTCLILVWEERILGRRASLETCRAELKAKVELLKCTKWKHYSLHNSAVLLDEIINLHFC